MKHFQTSIFFIAFVVTAFQVLPVDAATQIKQTVETLEITFENGTQLNFQLSEGDLLGLRSAKAEGLVLSHARTLLRPIVADDAYETNRPWVVYQFALQDVKVKKDGSVELWLDLSATRQQEVIRSLYLWKGRPALALGDKITPELAQAKIKADAAVGRLNQAAEKTQALQSLRETIAEQQKKLEGNEELSNRERRLIERELTRLQGLIPKLREEAYPDLARSDRSLAEDWQALQQYRQMLKARALEVGEIHRDYFGSALFRLPSQTNTAAHLESLKQLAGDDTFEVGKLKWVFKPVEINIAGWPYRGWVHHYELELKSKFSTRHFRETGTWELAGDPVGTTVIALRYRGLGGVDETFKAGASGGIDRNFTTTETIPGAAGGAPLISPVVPPSDNNRDRGFGIAHRVSPWIGRMVRGAGSPLFEFQHREQGVFVSFPDRLTNLRAVTEAFAGDAAISQTNEELFGRTSSLTTTPMYYLALAAPEDKPFALNECRTRWQEVDQYTCKRVSDELGFKQAEPLPGVGLNLDTAWEKRIGDLTSRMDFYADLGVRMILVHQPGWMNGRGMKETRDPKYVNLVADNAVGDCTIYDYVPRPSVGKEWKALTHKLAEHKVAYLVWSSYFSVGPGQFIQELRQKSGLTEKDFANFEYPDAMTGNPDFFDRSHVPHNPRNEKMLKGYVDRIDQARDNYGLHGFWADSWQKWALLVENTDERAPVYRAWMEQFARWSQSGMAFVSEGHGSPIMSCSIELSEQKFVDEWWFMGQTTLWYRGNSRIPGHGSQAANEHTFRLMANKCWPYVETGWGQSVLASIPDFKRLAHEYNAALPSMRRSYILSDDAGVLWLPYDKDNEGVLFPFKEIKLNEAVTARSILKEGNVDVAKAYQTYAVKAKDLMAAFELRRGPEPDPRQDWRYEPMQYHWPKWATERTDDP